MRLKDQVTRVRLDGHKSNGKSQLTEERSALNQQLINKAQKIRTDANQPEEK